MKKLLITILAVAVAAIAYAKYTASAEKIATVGLTATWTSGGAAPDTAQVSAQLTRDLVNDDDATDVKTLSNGAIGFDGLRTDRSVQVGAGPTLTYRTVTLYYLKMVGDARANPPAP
jgi:hypothetical protein